MKLGMLVGLILLGSVTISQAATITITTTSEQDAALVTLRTKLNATRPTPLTAAEFRDYLISQWMDSLVGQAGEQTKMSVREAWEKANTTTRDQVRTLLGVQ